MQRCRLIPHSIIYARDNTVLRGYRLAYSVLRSSWRRIPARIYHPMDEPSLDLWRHNTLYSVGNTQGYSTPS